jgi:hypothetical protein
VTTGSSCRCMGGPQCPIKYICDCIGCDYIGGTGGGLPP